jgi:predicted RNase H-like nuclease (RuvC/YqgF family)
MKNGLEILQEEMLKERAETLGHAGNSLSAALRKLEKIASRIDCKLESFKNTLRLMSEDGEQPVSFRKEAIGELNREIEEYNRAREYAELRYYYLIVIREASGFCRHEQVEKTYRVPSRMRYLAEKEF